MDVILRSLVRAITAALAVSTVTGLMAPQPNSWPDMKRYLQRSTWFNSERYPQLKSWFEAERYPQRKSWSDVERYPQRKSWSDVERHPQRKSWADAERYSHQKSWADAERYPQRNFWFGFPFRRQVKHNECSSYIHLMELVMSGFFDDLGIGFNNISDANKPVTSEILRSFSNAMCRALADEVSSLHEVIEKCPNAEQVRANLHVFGGLCTDEGETTPFLDNLISDFRTSYAFTPGCMEQIRFVLSNCSDEEMEPQKDMVAGPKAYKRIVIDQENCNSKGFDDVDSDACGDIRSLKKLAIILDVFFNIGPGVTFSMSDFQF